MKKDTNRIQLRTVMSSIQILMIIFVFIGFAQAQMKALPTSEKNDFPANISLLPFVPKHFSSLVEMYKLPDIKEYKSCRN